MSYAQRCVSDVASQAAVRSQFSPLPGAGVSWPAASRHSPDGVVTVLPAIFQPDAFIVLGQEAAHSACM